MRITGAKRTLLLLRSAAAGCVRDGVFGMGAALAFYAVFALAPLLVAAMAVAGSLLGDSAAQEQFTLWAERYFGSEGARAVQNMILGAPGIGSGVAATVGGAATLFFGATGVFIQLKRSLNTIWGTGPRGQTAVRRIVRERLAALGAACGIGLVVILGLLLSAGIAALGGFLGRWLPLPAGFLFAVNLVLSPAIVAPLVAFVFKYMPDAEVPWRSVWVGSLVTAVLFQLGAVAIGVYLGARVLVSTYGAAGSVLALLIWAYYSAQTALFGMEFTKAHADARRRSATQPAP
jgi:membrane protein